VSRSSPLTSAPPFELSTQKGGRQSLQALLDKGPLLLAFHRGTW
jgi:peroxiredoxin